MRHRANNFVSDDTAIFTVGGYCSFGNDYLHDVAYQSGEPAVSVHAHSPAIGGLTYYDQTNYGFVARECIEEKRQSIFRTNRYI